VARPKVVFEANVFGRALINPKRINARLVASLDRDILIISMAIVEEIVEGPSRPEVLGAAAVRKLGAEWFPELLRRAPVVSPTIAVSVRRNPDNHKFLEAAIAAGAEYVVTSDKDLRDLGEYEGVNPLPGRVPSGAGEVNFCFAYPVQNTATRHPLALFLGHPWGTLATVRDLHASPLSQKLDFTGILRPLETSRIVGDLPKTRS
jgi:putative PIN family toxin of toxin-antitoxin system